MNIWENKEVQKALLARFHETGVQLNALGIPNTYEMYANDLDEDSIDEYAFSSLVSFIVENDQRLELIYDLIADAEDGIRMPLDTPARATAFVIEDNGPLNRGELK